MHHENKCTCVEQNKDVKWSNSCYIVPSLVAVFQKLLVDSTDFYSVLMRVVRLRLLMLVLSGRPSVTLVIYAYPPTLPDISTRFAPYDRVMVPVS